jgi:hypothetical protein
MIIDEPISTDNNSDCNNTYTSTSNNGIPSQLFDIPQDFTFKDDVSTSSSISNNSSESFITESE